MPFIRPWMRRTRRLLTRAVLLPALLVPIGSVSHADTPPSQQRESASKAGYLFNFVKLVDWPPGAPMALTLCVLDDSGVYAELMKIVPGKSVGSRALAVRSVSTGDLIPHAPYTGCQVLYVAGEQMLAGRAVVEAHLPLLLTVSDAPGFLESGGVIELFTEGDRLRFRINLDHARRAGPKLSSSLLQLASTIEQESTR